MLRSSKLIRGQLLVACITLLLLYIALPAASAASKSGASVANSVTIKVDGTEVKLTDPVRVSDGRLFLPIADLAVLFKAKTAWDSDNEAITINTANKDTIVLSNGVPVVYFNEGRYRMDTAPFVVDGRVYIPLRHVAELLHAKVKWDADAQLAELETVNPVVVKEDYGLTEIGKEYSVNKSVLLKRNGLKEAGEATEGTALKVVIPSIFDQEAAPFSDEDYRLLAKLVQVEVGYETYDSQLAVANVVLNRVADSRFPDSIRDVIYSGKQFPPAHNGLLDKSTPNASVLRAAKDALNGKNNVRDAVYFYNPKVTKGAFWSGLETIGTIGSHRFAK
ncbi:cell wall hydrolase [Cohnella terricola]|uniref:Cell wall hydrolase n=1 Tax=Cohnella terricola TaxID=1289167 RepID=A0A559JTU7_9BACL|nr:cell wall hydrolase [Cohnella terricola]TVY03299.1 cell wall hydrolase [Cohnella terricola]